MASKSKVYKHLNSKNSFKNDAHKKGNQTFHVRSENSSIKEQNKEKVSNLVASNVSVIKSGIEEYSKGLIEGTFKKDDAGRSIVKTFIDGVTQEYFVPRDFTKYADNNDKVNFVLEKNREGKPVARVVHVVSTSEKIVFGMVQEKDGKFVFIPDNKQFNKGVELVQNEYAKLAVGKRCSAVVLNVRKSKMSSDPVQVEIKYQKEIFGEAVNPMSGVYTTLKQYEVTPSFAPEIEKEVLSFEKIGEEEIKNRRDLRNKPFFTIDPLTCKDMDDAVLVEPLIKDGQQIGYKLYVAIADVAHYVKPGTAVDKEAYERGNSIYPAGLVVPMLPKKLSNDLCSLNPNEDKPVMITEMDIDMIGEVLGYDIYEGVINSRHKFAYEEVSAVHHNDEEALKKFSEYKEAVTMLYDLRDILHQKSEEQGSIFMEGYDPTIVLNETKDKVTDFRNDNHVDSHDVIAQAMIINNYVVAKFLNDLEISNVLRTHKDPNEASLERLVKAITDMGVHIQTSDIISPEELYKEISHTIQDSKFKKVIHTLMIRSMRKAEYHTDKEIGHFALGLGDYTHFTSPIRRYVDLIEHRITKEAIKTIKAYAIKEKQDVNKPLSELVKTVSETTKQKLKEISNEAELYLQAYHLSTTERKANEISLKTNLICMALYMEQFVGQIKKGYISKIDKDGIIITLSDKNDPIHSDIIEVKVSLKQLKRMSGGYEVNDSCTMLKTRKKSNIKYKLGSTVEVKILDADPIKREITGTLDLTKENTSQNDQKLEQ